MSNTEDRPGDVILLDEHQFYWTLIERAAPLRGDPNHPAARLELDEIFERDVPETFSSLVVRYATASDRCVVGCAIASERVRVVLDSHESVVVLRPRDLPVALIERLGVEMDAQRAVSLLNFLQDEFEPLPVARLRERKRRGVVAGFAASLLLIAVGLWFRALAASSESLRLSARTNAILMGELSSDTHLMPTEKAALMLRQELDRLRHSRGASAQRLRPRDAAAGLEALLAAWPADLETRTNSLQISADQITLGVEVPSIAEAERLAVALSTVSGWMLQKPRTDVYGGAARVSAVLRPAQNDAVDEHSRGRL